MFSCFFYEEGEGERKIRQGNGMKKKTHSIKLECFQKIKESEKKKKKKKKKIFVIEIQQNHGKSSSNFPTKLSIDPRKTKKKKKKDFLSK